MQMHSLRLIVTVTHVGGDATAVADGDVGNHCVDFAVFVFPVKWATVLLLQFCNCWGCGF